MTPPLIGRTAADMTRAFAADPSRGTDLDITPGTRSGKAVYMTIADSPPPGSCFP